MTTTPESDDTYRTRIKMIHAIVIEKVCTDEELNTATGHALDDVGVKYGIFRGVVGLPSMPQVDRVGGEISLRYVARTAYAEEDFYNRYIVDVYMRSIEVKDGMAVMTVDALKDLLASVWLDGKED